MNIDGGSLFYVYGFLKDLSETLNVKLISFRISKEDLVLKKTFYENYTSYQTFFDKHFEIIRYRPFCETGAYYRLQNFKVSITDYLNTTVELFVYIENNIATATVKTNTSGDVYSFVINKTNSFIKKLEYVIAVRKARYVDPCYVDDEYIDEHYND